MMKRLIFSAILAGTGCSTVLVTHVHSNDYETPGLRYFLPAPYLLVKNAVEVSRTEALYSMSPIDRTSLRLVVPCDDGQTPCRLPDKVVPRPVVPGAQSGRPGGGGPGGAPVGEDSAALTRDGGERRAEGTDNEAGKDEGAPATAIVWLPDYCQQYAMLEKNHSGSQKVQIQLADGWKLTALNNESNNTDVLQKMFDTLTNVAGSMVNPARKVSASTVPAAPSSASTGAQGGRTRLFRRTRTVTFKPGLYPLLHYPLTADNETDCSKLPSFRPPKDATLESESWSELAASHDSAGSILAAEVEPGRPANPGRPVPR